MTVLTPHRTLVKNSMDQTPELGLTKPSHGERYVLAQKLLKSDQSVPHRPYAEHMFLAGLCGRHVGISDASSSHLCARHF